MDERNEQALTNEDRVKLGLINECLKIINKD